MHPTVKAIIDPRKPAAFYALPHLLVIALAVLIAFALGVFAGQSGRFTPAYYRHAYQAPLSIPSTKERISVPRHVSTIPTTGSIHFQYFMTQTNQQGPIGSCEAWAFTKMLSYAFNWNRQPNGKHYHRFYSPRFPYDVVSNGQDAGSYLEQYPPVVSMQGIPRWIEFPYGDGARYAGYQAYAVDYPISPTTKAAAAAHHISISEQPLFQYPGAGQGGVDLIRAALATHHVVNLDFPVYPEYDRANADGSTVVPPSPGETERGGHANTGVRYDDAHQNPDGTTGAVLASNQWGPQAGVGADGVQHSNASNGYIWLSYSFIRAYVFGASIIHVASSSTGTPPPPTYIPSHAPLHEAPKVTHRVSLSPKAGQIAQVKGIITNDTGVNISRQINDAAAAAGVSAPGYAALIGVESGIHQYAPHTPINGAGYCDYSAGLTQITVCTAASLGVGNGLLTQSNIDYVFWYEQASAARDVTFSGGLVARMHRNVCYDFPWLYAAWNMGDGYGCSLVYRYPTNPITQNAVRIYNGWWLWVWSGHVYYKNPTPPPPPKPIHHYKFPKHTYQQYRRRHHLKPISPYYHHKLSFAASTWWTVQNKHGREVLGGIVRHERWNSRREVMTGYYQGGKIFTFPLPRQHGWKPVIERHRWIR